MEFESTVNFRGRDKADAYAFPNGKMMFLGPTQGKRNGPKKAFPICIANETTKATGLMKTFVKTGQSEMRSDAAHFTCVREQEISAMKI